jgi:hypothetical protein
MRKFTVFTVILTLIIVVVAAQVVANKYWPNLDLAFLTGENSSSDKAENPLPRALNLAANVLGADAQENAPADTQNPTSQTTSQLGLNPSTLPPTEFGDGIDQPTGSSDISGLDTVDLPVADDIIAGDSGDFESSSFKPAILNVYLNQDQLKSAGFTNATLETEAFDGFLYKTIYLQDLKDLKIFKNVVKSADAMLVKVYIIDVGPMNTTKDVYDTLKTRGSEGLDIEINETNSFGDNSFFMNDSRRQNVAFLTVRFGNLIYGFSYPKEYHPQVQNLIKLLDMEF